MKQMNSNPSNPNRLFFISTVLPLIYSYTSIAVSSQSYHFIAAGYVNEQLNGMWDSIPTFLCHDDTSSVSPINSDPDDNCSNGDGWDISVTCCRTDCTLPSNCGERLSCSYGKTYDEALALCENNGHRLCTLDEMLGDISMDTGCGFDCYYNWVSTPCNYTTMTPTTGEPTVSLSPTLDPTTSPTVDFGDITFEYNSTENFTTDTLDIGWVEYTSCIEGTNPLVYNPDHSFEGLLHMAQYAVTVKILPSSNIPGDYEIDDYSLTADLCSNPVFALNNGYTLSWTLDQESTPPKITNMTDASNWIGTDAALDLLWQNDCYGIDKLGDEPTKLETGYIYHACSNGNGLRIREESSIQCYFEKGKTTGNNITVWLGFDMKQMRYCEYSNGEYAIMTRQPTSDPTLDPTTVPTMSPIENSIWIGDEPLSFSDAATYCLARGRNLVSIHDATDQAAAEALCAMKNHDNSTSYGCWIGLSEFFGDLVWTDGSRLNYGFNESGGDATGGYPWLPSQPSGGSDECVHLSASSYQWDDISCSVPNYPICADDGSGWTLYSRQQNPLNVSDEKLLTFIDIENEMRFEMDITVQSFPTNWANVFHCGETDDDRFPSIFIHGTSDTDGSLWEGFLVWWEDESINPGPALTQGVAHHIKLEITQTKWEFYVNDTLMYDGDKDRHETSVTVPCWASSSISGQSAADAVLNNIVITSDSIGSQHIIAAGSSWSNWYYFVNGSAGASHCVNDSSDQAPYPYISTYFDYNIVVGCCKIDGSGGVRPDCEAIGLNFFEARQLCADYGYKLCTADEMLADRTKGAGCSFDAGYSWTSTSCANITSTPTSSPTNQLTDTPTSEPTEIPTFDTSTDAVITWHCDDHSQLFLSRDAGSTWERQAVFEMLKSEVPTKGSNLVNISIDDEMHFAMDITVHSFPTGWANIFHCGVISGLRAPSIYLHPQSGTENATYEGFHINWLSGVSGWKSSQTKYALEIGETYHLEIIANQSWIIYQVDGEIMYSVDVDNTGHSTYDNVPCYLSNPWNTAADVTVSNIVIYSGGDSSHSSTVVIEDVDVSNDIIRVYCDNVGSWGGFIASVDYQSTIYSTTNPIGDGVWTLITNESVSSSLEYYGPKSDPPTIWEDVDLSRIDDDAYWIWGDSFDIGTMVFEMRFTSTTDEPTTAAPITAIPTISPSIMPTDDPTQPTIEPSPSPIPLISESITTGWPTMESVDIERYIMYLDGDFDELETYADDNDLSHHEVAEYIIELAMDLETNPELSNVEITISAVDEGSVIIDYTLESNIANMVSSATSNIDDMIGEIISVDDDFELTLLSNSIFTTTTTIDDAETTVSTDSKEGQALTSTRENGMGTTVVIALVVAVCILLLFVIAIWFHLKNKKQSDEAVYGLNMTNVNSQSKKQDSSNQTGVTPGSTTDATPGSMNSDDVKYEKIIEILKECDPDDWESHLNAFKKEKLTDNTLTLVTSDAGDDIDAFWKELIPQMGIRMAFKKRWNAELKKKNEMATPGRSTHGATIVYAENENEEVELEEARPDTQGMDIEEPAECEGNETGYDAPVVPGGGDGDVDAAVALPAEPDDVVALQEAAPGPAFAAAGPNEPNFKRGVTYDHHGNEMKENESSESDDNAMYEPAGPRRRQTRGYTGE